MRKLVHWEGALFSQIPATHSHGHAFWSCEVKAKLSPYHVPLQARQGYCLCVRSDLFPSCFFLPVPPQILWYCVQGCLYINLWLMYNYFSRFLMLTNCIEHSSLVCLMGKRSAAWWTGPPRAFMEVSGGLLLHWGRAEQNLHPISLLAQQHDCAWFTGGERRDGHPY